MTWTIDALDDHEVIVVQFKNTIDLAGYRAYEAGLKEAAAGKQHYRLLVLCAEKLQFNVETEDLRTFAHQENTLDKDVQRVIVAPESLTFGLSRLYSVESEGAGIVDRFTVVRSLDEACDCLKLPPSALTAYIA